MSQNFNENLPAILGGIPEFPEGPPGWPFQDDNIQKWLNKAYYDRSWGKYHGKYCNELINLISEYQESKHVMLCSSGTAAVELALRGLKVGKEDEVIIAAYDFDGNYRNIKHLEATTVLVDVSPNNWNMDLDPLNEVICSRTKAILVSHLHGGFVPMKVLMKIAQEKGIPVIEDACQMPGAQIQGKKAGSWGDIGVISFGGSKTLTAGRGGALFTNNEEITQRTRLTQNRGNEAYPLSELQAAVVIPQLENLDKNHSRRAKNVQFIKKELETFSGLIPFKNGDNNSNHEKHSQPGYYKLGFQYNPSQFSGIERSVFCQAMQSEGIAMHEGFRSFHCIHSSRRFKKHGELTQATLADQNCIILHHPILLKSETEIRKIVQAVSKIQQHSKQIYDAYKKSL